MDNLTKEMFEDIIAFSVSEPMAMGTNDMSFYRENGESFNVFYLSYMKEGRYEELEKLYPPLKECFLNGPKKNEKVSQFEVVIGAEDRETTVPDKYRHIYLDYGNHLIVKEEFYHAITEILKGKSNFDITFNWTDYLDEADIASQISEIREAYLKQERSQEDGNE